MSGSDAGAWRRIEPTIVHKVGYRKVVDKTFIQPDGTQHTYTTMGAEGQRAAACLAITAEGQVIVAKQFRPGPEKMMYELPGGGVEPNEEPQQAAVRELREETGYTPGKVIPLGAAGRGAYTNGLWYYYLATGCVLSGDGQALDSSEHIEVCLISVDQLLHNARHDQLTDPVAVLYAYDELVKLKEDA